jgi:hypothetical protein
MSENKPNNNSSTWGQLLGFAGIVTILHVLHGAKEIGSKNNNAKNSKS